MTQAGPADVRPRETTRLYQTAARVWLTAAGLSLLLPAETRLGVWLPLHLALAGAVSVAISGAMQNFASSLTATPAPPQGLVWLQFTLVNAGALLVTLGRATGHPGVVGTGGTSFVAAAVLLALFVWRARRRALNRRHGLPLVMYGFAVLSMLIGGTFGALIGSGVVPDVDVYLAFRRAHVTLNVLGWASATIIGTLVTLLPTVLRVRMPQWHGASTALLFAAGVTLAATGLATGLPAVSVAGGVALMLAAAGLGWLTIRVLFAPRRWPVPAAAGHLVAALVWFGVGVVTLAVALARGAAGFDEFRPVFLLVFVGGWILQTLLGAWLYLLPMARPAHPEERRRFLAAAELGARLQLVGLNAGLALCVIRAAGWVPARAGTVGVGLALGAAAVALLKAWTYPWLGRIVAFEGRPAKIWGG